MPFSHFSHPKNVRHPLGANQSGITANRGKRKTMVEQGASCGIVPNSPDNLWGHADVRYPAGQPAYE